ncbi:hypothetical protein SLOPH_884 [Spraguea lophii 42_110]|uniref:Uncharacterized protein n=1 Tax=Spraguea lophii (strain 42_110) TaxID=1358809 RepID=S7W8E0_SPRLO|nr:hypothetical protein SLOPH_884 [Spraguea lophii 42_110]
MQRKIFFNFIFFVRLLTSMIYNYFHKKIYTQSNSCETLIGHLFILPVLFIMRRKIIVNTKIIFSVMLSLVAEFLSKNSSRKNLFISSYLTQIVKIVIISIGYAIYQKGKVRRYEIISQVVIIFGFVISIIFTNELVSMCPLFFISQLSVILFALSQILFYMNLQKIFVLDYIYSFVLFSTLFYSTFFLYDYFFSQIINQEELSNISLYFYSLSKVLDLILPILYYVFINPFGSNIYLCVQYAITLLWNEIYIRSPVKIHLIIVLLFSLASLLIYNYCSYKRELCYKKNMSIPSNF